MKISGIKRQALSSLKGNWGKGVLITLIVFLTNMCLSLLGEIIISGGFSQWFEQDNAPVGANLFSILISIVLIPFNIAVYWFYIHLVRKENLGISQVFLIYKDGRKSLQLIGASLLQGLYVFLWFLLFIIPGIIKSISYSQMYYILKDFPELTVFEAITESRKRMKGFKWKYFLMNLSFIGWGILSLLTLGIGLLWLVPYIGTTNAAFYNNLIFPQDHKGKE